MGTYGVERVVVLLDMRTMSVARGCSARMFDREIMRVIGDWMGRRLSAGRRRVVRRVYAPPSGLRTALRLSRGGMRWRQGGSGKGVGYSSI